jgi:hypothetical protein
MAHNRSHSPVNANKIPTCRTNVFNIGTVAHAENWKNCLNVEKLTRKAQSIGSKGNYKWKWFKLQIVKYPTRQSTTKSRRSTWRVQASNGQLWWLEYRNRNKECCKSADQTTARQRFLSAFCECRWLKLKKRLRVGSEKTYALYPCWCLP